MSEYTKPLGVTLNPLTKIEYKECTVGNAVTDAMLYGEWAGDVTIAFANNGGIRSEISAGEITGILRSHY